MRKKKKNLKELLPHPYTKVVMAINMVKRMSSIMVTIYEQIRLRENRMIR